MADITNKEDWASGFGAGLALMGLVCALAAGVHWYKGGDLNTLNPLKSKAQQTETVRPLQMILGIGPEAQERRRQFNLELSGE